jgi:chromosome partitioning protein
VLTQAPSRSRLADGAVRQLAALGRLAPVTIGFRAHYPAAAIGGQAAVEFPGTKAAEEVTQLRGYVETLLGGDHGGKA